jgi:DNA polymerase elongation subunit (family B)
MNMYVPTYLSDNSGAGTYGGGYVKDPLVGFYLWLLSIDATSLYPSIERTLNTSPETILPSDNFIRITPDDILNNTKVYRSEIHQGTFQADDQHPTFPSSR